METKFPKSGFRLPFLPGNDVFGRVRWIFVQAVSIQDQEPPKSRRPGPPFVSGPREARDVDTD